jgi:hypothetical protein
MYGQLMKMETRPSEFHMGQIVTVGPTDTGIPQRTGEVTELIEIRYHNCPSATPGRTWWPKVLLLDGTHAVFCPEVVHPVSSNNVHITIEAVISKETAEHIQLFLNDPDPDNGAGFAFLDGHGLDIALDADEVKLRP